MKRYIKPSAELVDLEIYGGCLRDPGIIDATGVYGDSDKDPAKKTGWDDEPESDW